MKLRILLMAASLALSVAIGLAVSRSGENNSDSAKNDHIRIGFSMDTLKEARWQKDRDIFIAKAEAMGAEVLVQSANSNDTKQMQDVQGLISRGVDVLVIVPHDGKAMGKAVDTAAGNGIPVISYDRMITGTENLGLYISFDNVKVGEAQAQYLVDSVLKEKAKIRIVRIYGSPTDNNAKLFKQGQDNILNPLIKSGSIEVVHEDWATDWRPEVAKQITNAAITRNGSAFDAILASNDGTAGGAIQALSEEGLAGKIFVTGQDADLPALQRIVAGTQAMTIYKPISLLAETAAEIAVKMAEGKPVIARSGVNNGAKEVPSILVEVSTVTKDNIRQTVVKDGFHSEADIYRNAPADGR
ncbi:MAG: substrate-binding domain-containing protein [Verrucomicrobia bacterium]|jgi:D-xylose transport system substrate-binding protein|nr:substrate-binding domain-containing protein [Verrucomicrobiota bacterium]|tara:strand:- start:3231 stop:4301 length:1071 start_codon:yes stop_codon:yes gene_type:complete